VLEIVLVSGHRSLEGQPIWRAALHDTLVEIKDAIRWRSNARMLVVSGAAAGPDSWGLEWATERYLRGVLGMAWPVSWQDATGGYDRHAAFQRNRAMVAYIAGMATRADVYAHGLFVTHLSPQDMNNPRQSTGTAKTWRYWHELVTPDSDTRTVQP
jgi:hypothetical protein